MRVVALFRVSTERQASEGASLDAQEREYDEIADREGWETLQKFRGHESATQAVADRHVLQRVLACVRDREPDAIYVHEQSRLTRGDELEVALLMRELRERGIKIIVHGVIRDLGSIDERFMVGIQSLVDRTESERIKERMRRGKRQRAKEGKKSSGPAPYGYCNPLPGSEGRGTLQVVDDRAQVVRRIFELAIGEKSERAIAEDLNDRGIPSPRGGKWGKTTVRRILDNPVYIGVSASNVWVAKPGSRTFRLDLNHPEAVIVEDAHLPIVPREHWDAVHGRPSLPRTLVPRMLTGLLWVDGRRYNGDRSRGVAYYRGPRGMRGGAWLDVEHTDAVVWSAFASLATEPEFVERLMREAYDSTDQEIIAREIEYLEDQIGRLQRRQDRLVTMRADGEIDKATFTTKSDESHAAIGRLSKDLAGERSKAMSRDGHQAARVVKAVQLLLAGKTRLTTDQKRRILRSIVTRVDVEAVRSGAQLPRDSNGRVTGRRDGPRWQVSRVAFRLALPAQDAALGDDGPHVANHELAPSPADENGSLVLASGGPDEPASRRDGHMVTTSSHSDHDADKDSAGSLGTTF